MHEREEDIRAQFQEKLDRYRRLTSENKEVDKEVDAEPVDQG